VAVAALGRECKGTVYEIGVVADPLTRTYPVKITLANAEGVLKVGMVVDAFLPLPGQAPALAVPRESVRIDEHGSPCVFVVGPDQKLQRRRVELVGFSGERIALGAGVNEGERVVVSGTPMLADGAAVRLAVAE
jgi:RND family efflux transporter MFP subunit